MKQWSNEKVTITYREDERQLSFRDKTDPYNEPAGYSKKVRGIKKAVEFLEKEFLNEQYSFDGIISKLDDLFDLNIHTYCAMD